MNRQRITGYLLPFLAVALCSTAANAQVAVPEIEEIQEIPVISDTEIEELIGPIALYPDDLLAIVLPAATFPLQIVEAGRFLEELEDNPSIEPDEEWDDSIIALLNYPEVVELLNEDLDWTWRLGEAVVGQQSDVIAAIERFRDRAYAAGNLKSDEYQLVAEENGAIQITPVEEDVIYVPYYEPEEVVVYQPRPVYFYYARPYPVYYYPYPSYYSFYDRFYHHRFWGVTTAFSVAWPAYHLSVYHHSYNGHPYYGRIYRDRWWYRRPDIHIHNNIYVNNNVNVSTRRDFHGDYWMPSNRRTVSYSDGRITRTRYYPSSSTPRSVSSVSNINRQATGGATSQTRTVYVGRGAEREKIEFQPRAGRPTSTPAPSISRDSGTAKPSFAPRPSSPRVTTTAKPSTSRSAPQRPTAAPAPSKPRVSTTRRDTSVSRNSSPPRSAPTAKPSTSRRDSSASKPSVSKPSTNRSSKSAGSSSRSSASKSTPTRRSDNSGSRPRSKKEH